MRCARCGNEVGPGPFGRRDTCSTCGAELHACVQCDFYAPGQYNDCREPQAERVLDKERSNFCDFFRPSGKGPTSSVDPKEEARKKLEALFRKDR